MASPPGSPPWATGSAWGSRCAWPGRRGRGETLAALQAGGRGAASGHPGRKLLPIIARALQSAPNAAGSLRARVPKGHRHLRSMERLCCPPWAALLPAWRGAGAPRPKRLPPWPPALVSAAAIHVLPWHAVPRCRRAAQTPAQGGSKHGQRPIHWGRQANEASRPWYWRGPRLPQHRQPGFAQDRPRLDRASVRKPVLAAAS